MSEKLYAKHVTKNRLQFQLEQRPYCRPETVRLMSLSESGSQILYKSNVIFFLDVCNLASRVAVFVGSTACFYSGVPLVLLRICLHCQMIHVDFNFEISHWCT